MVKFDDDDDCDVVVAAANQFICLLNDYCYDLV